MVQYLTGARPLVKFDDIFDFGEKAHAVCLILLMDKRDRQLSSFRQVMLCRRTKQKIKKIHLEQY